MENFCKECITAKNKFRKGDRVVLSVQGCKIFPGMIENKSIGQVVGFGKSYNVVRIVVDGQKTPVGRHSGFWERI